MYLFFWLNCFLVKIELIEKLKLMPRARSLFNCLYFVALFRKRKKKKKKKKKKKNKNKKNPHHLKINKTNSFYIFISRVQIQTFQEETEFEEETRN